MSKHCFTLLALACIIVLGTFLYSNTLHAPFLFDDVQNITENKHIRISQFSASSLLEACRKSPNSNRPVANISFALNYYFHNYEVAGYHIVNIFVHLLTGIFFYFFLAATLSISGCFNIDNANARAVILFACLLWLAHPVQTQSVTYIVQRMNSMSAMFFVLSLLCYAKGRLASDVRVSWGCFTGCALSGVLALGSKENAVTLPFFILLWEWYFLQDLSLEWIKKNKHYFYGVMVLLVVVIFVYLGKDPFHAVLADYKYRDFTLTERLLTQLRVVVFYIGLLFYPTPSRLTLDHDFALSHSLVEPFTTILSLFTLAGLFLLSVVLARKERLISFGILWFLGNLVVESSIIGLEIIFEHRLYLPSLFFLVIPVWLAYRHIKPSILITSFFCGILLLFSLWTYQRNNVWRDEIVFLHDNVSKAPMKARPHYNLGLSLSKNGKLQEAVKQFLEALRLEPRLLMAQEQLAITYSELGQVEKAVTHYLELLRIVPSHVPAHQRLGLLYANQGQYENASEHFSTALRIEPGNLQARFNLATTLHRLNNLSRAMILYREVLRIDPEHAQAHNNLALALAANGKLDEAVYHFSEALRIDPGYVEARRNLAVSLKMLRSGSELNPKGGP